MVFPSIPVYLDPPNWNQQPSHQPGIGVGSGGGVAPQLPPVVQPRPEGTFASSGKPDPIVDRARLAKVPQPEPGLKCPRCESTNTKFCYFNNYSFSQPRHFCKTCRRYWTRGGALRNVPVGGGCRRNKRSKSSNSDSSKSSSAFAGRHAGASASSMTSAAASGGGAVHSNVALPQPQLPFMTSLHPIADYEAAANIGLNFGGVLPMDAENFHAGSGSGPGMEQWRLQQVQQFPFLGGLEPQPAPPSMGLFLFDGQGMVDGGSGGFAGQVQGKPSAPRLNTHLPSVKIEQDPEGLRLPRRYLDIPSNHYWGGGGGSASGGDGGSGGWTDLSGFNPASGSSIL